MKKLILILVMATLFLHSCLKDNTLIPIEEVLDGDYTITVNPNEIAPLTATIEFRTLLNTTVKYSLEGDERFLIQFDALNKVHKHSIYGLFPDSENKLILEISNNLGETSFDTLVIKTDSIPYFLPDIQIINADKKKMEPGWTLCCTALGDGEDFLPYTITFDENGVIRSLLRFADNYSHFCTPMEPLKNGNLIFGCSNSIHEYNFMGKEIQSWELDPKYHLHHDIIEKPNGNLIVAVADHSLPTVDDIILELDRNSGDIVNRWDVREVMDMDRYDLVEDDYDWFHMNAIWYSEPDDCLVVSGRNQGVIKITNDNQLVWILAPHQGWGKAGIDGNGFNTSDFLLTAVDADGNPYGEDIQNGQASTAQFSWAWGQHAPMYLPNGHLFLFDNGFNRNFSNAGPYSQGVEYIIDEQNKTVHQLWAYGKDRGSSFYSAIISDVDYLPKTKNRLITSGITFSEPNYSTIVEVSYPDKTPVFEAILSYKDAFVPEGTPFGWGALDLTYRTERIHFFKY